MTSHANLLAAFVVRSQVSESPIVERVANCLLKNGKMTLPQLCNSYKSTAKIGNVKKEITQGLAVLIKHDLVAVNFASPGVKNNSADLSWVYTYEFKTDQSILRLSLPRLFNHLFCLRQKRSQVSLEILTAILTNGSLFKHEIDQLLQKQGFNKNEIEKAIQQLTLTQFIKGATNVRAQMEAALNSINTEAEESPTKKREIKQKMKEE